MKYSIFIGHMKEDNYIIEPTMNSDFIQNEQHNCNYYKSAQWREYAYQIEHYVEDRHLEGHLQLCPPQCFQ